MIWNIKFDKVFHAGPELYNRFTQRSFGFNFFQDDMVRGVHQVSRFSDIERDALNQLSEHPDFDYAIRGLITYRVVSEKDWSDRNEDMCSNPSRYLYLTEDGQRYPEPPAMVTHESRMADFLARSAEATAGFTTFRVGAKKTEFRVDDNLLQSVVKVPLLHEWTIEGAPKTVKLLYDDAIDFKVFHEFIHTLKVSDQDLSKHASHLLMFATKYQIEMLHYICEYYLCWCIQNFHSYDPDEITAVLRDAFAYGADTLKVVCFEFIHSRGLGFMPHEQLSLLPREALIELILFSATKRETHMPELSRKRLSDAIDPETSKRPKESAGP